MQPATTATTPQSLTATTWAAMWGVLRLHAYVFGGLSLAMLLASTAISTFVQEDGILSLIDQVAIITRSFTLAIGIMLVWEGANLLIGQGVPRQVFERAAAAWIVVAATASGLIVALAGAVDMVMLRGGDVVGRFLPHLWDSSDQVALVFGEQFLAALGWGAIGLAIMGVWRHRRGLLAPAAVLGGVILVAIEGIAAIGPGASLVARLATIAAGALLADRLLRTMPIDDVTVWTSASTES